MRDLLRLLRLLLPEWKSMLAAAAWGFATVASNVGLLATSAYLIARAAQHPPVLYLMVPIVGVRFFGIARAAFRYLERYFSHDATFRVLERLRVRFYAALEPLAPAGLLDQRGGDLLSRIVGDVETLRDFFLRAVAPPLVAAGVLTAVAAFLGRYNAGLAWAVVAVFGAAGMGVPVAALLASRGVGRKLVRTRARLQAALVDSIQGMADLQAFGQARRQLETVESLSRELEDLQTRTLNVASLSGSLTGLAGNLAAWCVLALAIPLVAQRQLDGVYLAMLMLAASSAFEAVMPLPQALQYLEQSLAAARRLFAVVDRAAAAETSAAQAPPACASPLAAAPRPTRVAPAFRGLQVEGLRFRYTAVGPWVLDGVHLQLPWGGKLAVVGPSGAGKTTLVNLLLRFWDDYEGSIRLDGQAIRSIPPEELRNHVAVVAQNTHLFNATIRENLLLARPGATQAEMEQAAAAAQIDAFIRSLPEGFDTYVGEGGFKLSGGQRQRLAVARALLKDAPLLILDEATAGLDAVTEEQLWTALLRVMEGRTVLAISHRLRGLEVMDQIVVLEQGRVAETGRFEELLRRRGLFWEMWRLEQVALSDSPFQPLPAASAAGSAAEA